MLLVFFSFGFEIGVGGLILDIGILSDGAGDEGNFLDNEVGKYFGMLGLLTRDRDI